MQSIFSFSHSLGQVKYRQILLCLSLFASSKIEAQENFVLFGMQTSLEKTHLQILLATFILAIFFGSLKNLILDKSMLTRPSRIRDITRVLEIIESYEKFKKRVSDIKTHEGRLNHKKSLSDAEIMFPKPNPRRSIENELEDVGCSLKNLGIFFEKDEHWLLSKLPIPEKWIRSIFRFDVVLDGFLIFILPPITSIYFFLNFS